MPIVNNGNLVLFLFILFSCASCRRLRFPKPGDHLIQPAYEMFIGSLKLAVYVVQNLHAGDQATHWHKTNQELTSLEFPLFVFSQWVLDSMGVLSLEEKIDLHKLALSKSIFSSSVLTWVTSSKGLLKVERWKWRDESGEIVRIL